MLSLVLAYAGLFTWAFLAATVLPLSSEAALAALVYRQEQLLLPVLVATAGNYLGACTTYWLARRVAGRRLEGRQARLQGWLRRYGQPVLLLSWLPVAGDALVAVAGAMRLPFGAFSVWVALGKGLRYLAVALAVQQLTCGAAC